MSLATYVTSCRECGLVWSAEFNSRGRRFREHPLPHMTLRPAERRSPGNFRLLPDRRPLSRSRRPRFDETRSRLPRLLLENSLHDAGADAELLADLEDAVTAGPQL
jgi:hypothetical protein